MKLFKIVKHKEFYLPKLNFITHIQLHHLHLLQRYKNDFQFSKILFHDQQKIFLKER